MEFSYERLDVAKLARKLVVEIYVLTNSFPSTEKFGLISQIRRAAISVLLNIAEGSCRKTRKDFNNFIRMSLGSLVEADCALKISQDLGYIDSNDYFSLESKIKELYFKLIGLSKYLCKQGDTTI